MKNLTTKEQFLIFFFTSLLFTFFFGQINMSAQNDKKDFVKISENHSSYFAIENGVTWIPIMIDYIVPAGQKEEEAFETIETYFRNFSRNRGDAMRIWISSPFLEIEDQEAGKYNPVKFQRIDRLLKISEKYEIRIKFALHHIRSIGPNESWSNSTVLYDQNNGPFKNVQEYVGSEKGKKYYLDRARALSEKYKNNRQIFGWELWNEMDALQGVDEETRLTFTSEILDSIKVLFPHHLVTQTLGSLHSKDAEDRYKKLFAMPNNDFVSVHRYLDPGDEWDQYHQVTEPIDLLVHSAMEFTQNYVKNKPIVINEIGAVEADHFGPSKLYAVDTSGVLIHDMIFAPFFNGAAGTGGMWHWNDYIQHQNLWYHFERFAKVIEGIDPAKEGFKPFTLNKDGVRSYGLRGNSTTMLWCRDAANNWRTELEQNISAKPKVNFTIPLRELGENKFSSAKMYDPWTDEWKIIEIKDNSIILPSFTRSSVVVLF